MSAPTCDLRKACPFCGEMFGRKLTKPDRYGAQYLQSMATWTTTEACSKECRRGMQTRRGQELKAEREKAARVMDSFLFPGGVRL